MEKDWELLLSKFRRLGGIADNVCQKEGEFGRGIFSKNSNLRSRIFIPAKLMIKKDDICLEGSQLRIKKDKHYSKEFRDFFNYYQDNFSWGGGGKETTESFEKGLSLFNNELKNLIKEYLLIDIEARHKGNWNSVVKNQFLNAREVNFQKNLVIAPIWELVNHEVSAFPFLSTMDGLCTPNYIPRKSELTFVYGYKGSIGRVLKYGFFSKESIVFSLPFSISLKDSKFQLICKGLELKTDKINYQFTNGKIIIDGLPIVSINKPEFIRNYFEKLLELTNTKNLPKGLYARILRFNFLKRNQILEQLKLIDNFSSKVIARSISYEIDLISHV